MDYGKAPTPRTDAAGTSDIPDGCVTVDFACELERDLARARDHDESVCEALESRSAMLEATKAELVDAREEARSLKEKLDIARNALIALVAVHDGTADTTLKEWDDARAAIEKTS